MTFTIPTIPILATRTLFGANSSAGLKPLKTPVSESGTTPLNTDAIHFSQKRDPATEKFREHLHTILTAFNSFDPEMHLHAFETLNIMSDDERLKVLEMALSHHNNDIREQAVCQVLSLEEPLNRERFVYLALMSEERGIYTEAPYLIDAIDDPKKQRQFEAIVLNSFDSIQALLTLQKHTDLDSSPFNKGLLEKALQSKSTQVRSLAIKTIKNFNDPEFIKKTFIDLINSNEHNERPETIKEVKNLNTHPSAQVDILTTLLKSENAGIKTTALSLLPSIQNAFPLLNDVIDSVVAQDGDYQFIPLLIGNLVKSVSSQDRRNALIEKYASEPKINLANALQQSVLTAKTEQEICELLHIIHKAENPLYFDFSRALIYKLNDNGLRHFWVEQFPTVKILDEQGLPQLFEMEIFNQERTKDMIRDAIRNMR